MSSNGSGGGGGSSQGLPPFIPGLLIVSLLIVMSVLVAWRNYLRRNRMQTHVDAVGTEWPIRWEGNTLGPPRGRGKKLEKPKMWEIDVFPNRDPMSMKGLQWDDIMPLSITPLDSELSIDTIQGFKGPPVQVETTPAPSYSNSRSASSLRFQLARLPFFSRTQTVDVAPPVDHVDSNYSYFTKETSQRETLQSDEMTQTSDLQLSVMISMPSPYSRAYYPDDDSDGHTSVKPSSEKAPAHTIEYFESEGVPDVAFGIAVVPLRLTDSFTDDKEK